MCQESAEDFLVKRLFDDLIGDGWPIVITGVDMVLMQALSKDAPECALAGTVGF